MAGFCQPQIPTHRFEIDPQLARSGSMGHVKCPQSEPANNDLQARRAWMVAATNGFFPVQWSCSAFLKVAGFEPLNFDYSWPVLTDR